MPIKIMDHSISYLRINGIWPKKDTETNPGWRYYFKFAIIQLSTIGFPLGSILHLHHIRKHNSSYNLTEDLVMTMALIGGYYFLFSFVYYGAKIGRLVSELSDFERYGRPHDFDKNNKNLLLYSKVFIYYIDVAIMLFSVAPLYFSKKDCERFNRNNHDYQEICGLMVPTWMPFDIESFPNKQLYYLLQVWSLVMILKAAAVASCLISETLEHLVLRLQHLKSLLIEAVNNHDRKLLRHCIQYHTHLLDLGKRMDIYYSNCLFLHIFLSGALMGVIGYRLKEKVNVNSLALLSGWILAITINCLSAQRLMNEAESVGQCIYEAKWYDTDVYFQRMLHMIIKRSQDPIVVHAGPFTFLSHPVMLTIAKTAYSYLALLNATSK